MWTGVLEWPVHGQDQNQDQDQDQDQDRTGAVTDNGPFRARCVNV